MLGEFLSVEIQASKAERVLVFCCFCGSLNRSFQTLNLSLQPFQRFVPAALGLAEGVAHSGQMPHPEPIT
jgi:hypothetical protein